MNIKKRIKKKLFLIIMLLFLKVLSKNQATELSSELILVIKIFSIQTENAKNYSTFSKVVNSKNNYTKATLNINYLQSGIYLQKTTSNTSSKTKRIIIINSLKLPCKIGSFFVLTFLPSK
jgi:hypothetical protein